LRVIPFLARQPGGSGGDPRADGLAECGVGFLIYNITIAKSYAAEGYALIKRGTQPITGGRPAAGRTVQAALAALATTTKTQMKAVTRARLMSTECV
jgi:hypothetical protein